MKSALLYAEDWIKSVSHGDNCFVSNHYEGDPGNQCNCGRDSVLAAIEEALARAEQQTDAAGMVGLLRQGADELDAEHEHSASSMHSSYLTDAATLMRDAAEAIDLLLRGAPVTFTPAESATAVALATKRAEDAEQRAADAITAEDAEKHGLTTRGVIAFHHPMRQVMFRAGLLACREYMARFVEAQSPAIAASIRANWWPSLGADPGPPRLNRFDEWWQGGEPPAGRFVGPATPSIEAMPIAEQFMRSLDTDGGTLNARGIE